MVLAVVPAVVLEVAIAVARKILMVAVLALEVVLDVVVLMAMAVLKVPLLLLLQLLLLPPGKFFDLTLLRLTITIRSYLICGPSVIINQLMAQMKRELIRKLTLTVTIPKRKSR